MIEWLGMPMAAVEAHREAMPRIQAREQLALLAASAIASGNCDEAIARETLARWEEQAGIRREKIKPKSREDMKAALASMGLGYAER